jgi:hypothetical protein
MSRFSFIRNEANYYSMSLVVYSFLATLLITLGYLVAPVMFAELDSKKAGYIAGLLFNIGGYITIVLSLLLLSWHAFLKLRIKSNWPNLVVICIMGALLWVVSPYMAKIKAIYPLGLTKDSADWSVFASLHGIYQFGYLIVITALILAMLQSITLIRALVNK